MTWKKFNGEPIEIPILEEVEHAIERESALGNKLKVCIGTDSQVKGSIIDFATVIVFLREKKGGFMLNLAASVFMAAIAPDGDLSHMALAYSVTYRNWTTGRSKRYLCKV